MSLDVQNALLPLGPAWSEILTDIHVGLGSTPSVGKAFAYGPMDGGYLVSSFFDVFFDITVTDVDPSVNFPGMNDGAVMPFLNNGPANMANQYWQQPDSGLPNLGLLPPPQSAPYIGHFMVKIPLGADLNNNGIKDRVQFTQAQHNVGDKGRTWIILPDGTVVENFNTVLDLSGAVVDDVGDPPFLITLTGPTTGTAKLVPEPGAYALAAGLGLLGFGVWRRIRR